MELRAVIGNVDEPCVLSIDVGTSSLRTLLYDSKGLPVPGTTVQHGYPLVTNAAGGVEAPAPPLVTLLATSIDTTIAAARKGRQQIVAVGMTTHWHNLLGLDAAGRPTTSVLYHGDNRCAAQVVERHTDDASRLTGLAP